MIQPYSDGLASDYRGRVTMRLCGVIQATLLHHGQVTYREAIATRLLLVTIYLARVLTATIALYHWACIVRAPDTLLGSYISSARTALAAVALRFNQVASKRAESSCLVGSAEPLLSDLFDSRSSEKSDISKAMNR